jgi:hypothetical protein
MMKLSVSRPLASLGGTPRCTPGLSNQADTPRIHRPTISSGDANSTIAATRVLIFTIRWTLMLWENALLKHQKFLTAKGHSTRNICLKLCTNAMQSECLTEVSCIARSVPFARQADCYLVTPSFNVEWLGLSL